MEIISDTTDFNIGASCAVAIGKFDGIHKGHKRLVDEINGFKERCEGLMTAVFTFDPSPVAFFGDGNYHGITTRDEKRRIFNKFGIDYLIEYPLNSESAAMSPMDFMEKILVAGLHAKYVVCGPDFTFGYRGAGNVKLLKNSADRLGFEVIICEKVATDGEEISSSLIREEVERGNMERVAEYIGAPYSVTGIVQKGRQIGRTIGMPTVNLIPESDKLLPPFGVYKSTVSYGGGHYKGITNIGVQPTVTDEKKVTVETHIFDFDEDIYGKPIIVNLNHFIRPERKFESTLQLKQQIEEDIVQAYKD